MIKNYSILNCRHGSFLLQDNDLISRVVRAYGEWAEDTFRLVNRFIPVGGVVVDIGANFGMLSMPFSKAVGLEGRVYSFEAQARVFYALCANILLNGADNVSAKNLLIGDSIKSVGVPFFAETLNGEICNVGGQSFMPFLELDLQGLDSVNMTTVDEQLKNEHRIDMVKVDVEGAEEIVLVGAAGVIDKFRPVLYVECGGEALYEKIGPLLIGMRYDIYWHAASHFSDNNFFKMPNITGNFGDMNILCVPIESPLPRVGFDEFSLARCGDWKDLTRLFPGFQF